MKPLYASIILGPLIGFAMGMGIDRAVFPKVTESPTQEWCDAAYTRKATWAHAQNAPYKAKDIARNRSEVKIVSSLVSGAKDSPQTVKTQE